MGRRGVSEVTRSAWFPWNVTCTLPPQGCVPSCGPGGIRAPGVEGSPQQSQATEGRGAWALFCPVVFSDREVEDLKIKPVSFCLNRCGVETKLWEKPHSDFLSNNYSKLWPVLFSLRC